MLNMYNKGKLPLSEKDFDKTAKHFKVNFPDDYRAFMHTYNGGVLMQPNWFRYDQGRTDSISWFYDIDSASESDIVKANKMRKGRLPKNFVAIGCTNAGDEICMNCGSGEGFGKIYFWDHNFEADREGGETPDEAPNYFMIAESFTAFSNCLFEEPSQPQDSTPSRATSISTPEQEEFLYQLMVRKGIDVSGFKRRKQDD